MKKKLALIIAFMFVLLGCVDSGITMKTEHAKCMARNNNVLELCTDYEGR